MSPTIKLEFDLASSWPPLAWCAQIKAAERHAVVRHGSCVEVRETWFCEGVWDGPFEEGEFSTSDNFFGSGGFVQEKTLTFVSSCAPMDRLHHISVGGIYFVSNSLACLMSQSRSEIDPTYSSFAEECFLITQGIATYAQTLRTSNGLVTMTVCRNLICSQEGVVQVDKILPARHFRDFSDYERFMRASLAKIAENMRSKTRTCKYSFIAGISTGYDSPAICALARSAGLQEAFTFTKARGNLQNDDGSEIGKYLGIEVHKLDRYSWRKMHFPEVPFISSVGFPSLIELAGAESLLCDRVF